MKRHVAGGEWVLPAGGDLEATLRFFRDELGFRIESITPADDPALVRLSGHGLRLALDRACRGDAGILRLITTDGGHCGPLTAPNATRIEFVPAEPPPAVPAPVVKPFLRKFDDSGWTRGRAGMLYRDLIPDRLGGHLIASHIRIPEGGPVPDDVHFHDVRFQFIYCYRGWVRLVYEDQGEPFVMNAGDCVLQPPGIRHRVLEASPGLEVIELACPAAHMTHLDHEMALPTGRRLPGRDYDSQHFVLHQVRDARWTATGNTGFEIRDLGLESATRGAVRARVLRNGAGTATASGARQIRGSGIFVFLFVLQGSADASVGTTAEARLGPGGTCLARGDPGVLFRRCAPELQLLEVCCPA